ncbi:hypothetical protein PF002_g20778 [Phytophthora fragariae]|uniref:Uncharacterized protein n=1 Tax=Phytophthora fragariae TaxID=53985 RepID=A0A6A3XLH2_9STRA|nr:hypothetical protein PF002_g20778 [Phytophthora fragariae]
MSYSGGGGYDQHRDYGGRSASQDEPRGDFTRRQDYDPTGDGASFGGRSGCRDDPRGDFVRRRDETRGDFARRRDEPRGDGGENEPEYGEVVLSDVTPPSSEDL